jgi:hypothetical protein
MSTSGRTDRRPAEKLLIFSRQAASSSGPPDTPASPSRLDIHPSGERPRAGAPVAASVRVSSTIASAPAAAAATEVASAAARSALSGRRANAIESPSRSTRLGGEGAASACGAAPAGAAASPCGSGGGAPRPQARAGQMPSQASARGIPRVLAPRLTA